MTKSRGYRPRSARLVSKTTYRIYALVEDDTGAIRYVGQTAFDLDQRLNDHLRIRGSSARASWLRSLTSRPHIVELDSITGSRRDAYTLETHWIRKLRAGGHDLVNVP